MFLCGSAVTLYRFFSGERVKSFSHGKMFSYGSAVSLYKIPRWGKSEEFSPRLKYFLPDLQLHCTNSVVGKE